MKNTKHYVRTLFVSFSLIGVIVLSHIESARANDFTSKQQGLVEGALTYHPNLVIDHLQVDVSDGQAQLQGLVNSNLSKALAEQLAHSVKGIHSVNNRLRVAPEYFTAQKQEGNRAVGVDNRLSNVTISNKVKSQLLANRITSGMNVEVETSNRVVTINGQVQSEAEKALTYWIVRNTQGVRQVVNNLDILTEREQQALVQISE